MSIMKDVGRLWRGVMRIARSSFQYRENHRYGSDEIDVVGKDKVALSMANQQFALVYPPSQPICSVDTIYNTTSWSNFVLAFLSSIFIGMSAVIFALLLFSIMFVGTVAVLGGSAGAFPAIIVSNWFLTIVSGAASMVAGIGVRKIDRRLTMANCLQIAEQELRDPKIRLEQTALLEWNESKAKIRMKIDELSANIRGAETEVKRVKEMCEKISEFEHLSPFQIEADLKNHLASIEKLSGMIAEWRKLKSKFEERIKTLEQRNQQMRVMGAALIEAGPLLADVNSGKLKAEVSELESSIIELMDDIDKKNEYLHQDLLIESGLADDDKKPPQIE